MPALRTTSMSILLGLGLLLGSGCASREGTYRIEEGSFSLELPDGWHVEDYDQAAQYLQARDSSNSQYLTVSVGRGRNKLLIFTMGSFYVTSLDELAENARRSAVVNFQISPDTFPVFDVSEIGSSVVAGRDVESFTFSTENSLTGTLYRGTVYPIRRGEHGGGRACLRGCVQQR